MVLNILSVGEYAFNYCTSLTSITIPKSVTKIGKDAFHGCTGLTEIKIPDGVTSIGDNAFNRCTSLTSITIPNSVTEIGEGAFEDCWGLTKITIPQSVTEIKREAFADCTELEYIIVPEQFKNRTATFWQDRGVDINRTVISSLQEHISMLGLQKPVEDLEGGNSEAPNTPGTTLETNGLFSAASNNDTCNAPRP